MAIPSYPIPLDQFPADLIQVVVQQAAADAELVALFLDALTLRPTGAGVARAPLRFPKYFLVGLGAALRLLAWEENGLTAHRDAGLPSAHEALRLVARLMTTPEPLEAKERVANQLACCVLATTVERFAWSGRTLLGADLQLGEADEDALVDTLAKFLWTHRHDADGPVVPDRG